jgi:hypothetical protein
MAKTAAMSIHREGKKQEGRIRKQGKRDTYLDNWRGIWKRNTERDLKISDRRNISAAEFQE